MSKTLAADSALAVALGTPLQSSSSLLPEATDGRDPSYHELNEVCELFRERGSTPMLFWPLIIRIGQLPSPDPPFITLFERARETQA